MRGVREAAAAAQRNAGQGQEVLRRDMSAAVSQTRTANAREARQRIVERLDAEGADDLAKPLRECGAEFALTCVGCGGRHLTRTRCRKRWCPECARIVSAARLAKYEAAIAAMRAPIFVTLTMQHKRATSSPEDVRALRRALGRLRNRAWFKRKVKGGIASVEVTCGDDGWHPHVHMLVECAWLSVSTPAPDRSYSAAQQRALAAASQKEIVWQWESALGKGKRGGVWISRAGSNVASEVLKYAVKPGVLVDAQWPLAPLLRVLAVSRLISTWGSVRREHQRIASLERETDYTGLICPCGESEWVPEVLTPKCMPCEMTGKVYRLNVKQSREAAARQRSRDDATRALAARVALRDPWTRPAGELASLLSG